MQIREIVDDEDKVCLSVLGFSWLDFFFVFVFLVFKFNDIHVHACVFS